MKYPDDKNRQTLTPTRPKANVSTIDAALKALEAHAEMDTTVVSEAQRASKTKKKALKYRMTHTGIFLLSVVVGFFIVLCVWQIDEGRQYLNDQKEFSNLMKVADQRQEEDMLLSIKQLAYYKVKRGEVRPTLSGTDKNPYIQLQAQMIEKAEQQEKTATAFRKQQAVKKRPVLIISVSAARLIFNPLPHRDENQATSGVMPPDLSYRAFNTDLLKQYLLQKNSLLAESVYFNAMIQTAQSHNIDPRFLFAIAGQEQSLVPKSHPSASKIANNPFNIYNSWKKYNTTIHDSSEIVCNTIVNRMAKWNGKGSAIEFLNQTYAEDPQWAAGVEKYYRLIKEATGK